ncbi:MAG: hypothetical protein H0X25_19540 [Acidobacteriales bacterium]|nr:hypothetical protein [Terriglobales bacterium]
MHTVELYGRVRRAVVVEGKGKRQVAREFGISRHMVRKMLQHSVPPGYQRKQPARRPKLDPWLGTIDAILQEDQNQPRKQRHTAKRIFDRLREEYGYGGGYTIVKDFVRLKKLRGQEMFVPLAHPPGEAQADFGEAKVVIGGVEQTAHFLTLTLAYSDECFVMAFPAETTEAFLEQSGSALANAASHLRRLAISQVESQRVRCCMKRTTDFYAPVGALLLAFVVFQGCNALNPLCGSARPAPIIASLSVNTITFADVQQGFLLTVNGSDFVSASVVVIDGTAISTNILSSQQLQVTITTALISGPGTASVTVNTPSGNSGLLGCTSGGTSRALNLTIT